MTYSTQMNEIVEERYQFCIWLNLIKKNADKKNKEKRKRGEENVLNFDLFTCPVHIQKLFGPFMKTPQYTHIHTLEEHTNWVRCLTIHENKLISGSWDDTIRSWNTETYEKIATLMGHTRDTRGVSCLTLHENKLVSGSPDKTIRVWKI